MSILFEHGEDDERGVEGSPEPSCFRDLHLDQIVASLTSGRGEYRLEPFFYRTLRDVEAVRYRHQVVGELERADVREAVEAFARAMSRMREQLAVIGELTYDLQRQRWFLAAVASYCDGVGACAQRLGALELRSRGLVSFARYLAAYAASDEFQTLQAETVELEAELDDVAYVVHIKGNRVRVDRYDDQPDMTDAVVRAFAKFRQGAVGDHRVGFRGERRMNHVEARITELVARLHPEPFSHLEQYRERRRDYLDATVARFDREIQFYLAYLQYIEPLRTRGLQFSLPQVSTQVKAEHVAQAFDLALACSLIGTAAAVVPNDYRLEGAERILVVSGPNNGGKTTFARTFGQLHHLAGLGLPVPGADARLFLPDRIFTHFEREEDIATLRGKFEDELVRIHEILTQATPDSLVVMNESFGSTTLRDALLVGTDVL
ncbi:MAG: DNA mismatch repair protein MutS, partial [Solirubrobacteraceae bacterium]